MKNILKNNLLSILLLTSIASTPVHAGVDFDAGMNAYNKGNYDFAKILFEKAIKVNSADYAARYMYCQVLVKQKLYNEAKKEYEYIVNHSSEPKLVQYSEQGIKKINDYLGIVSDVPTNNVAQVSLGKKSDVSTSSDATDYVKNAYRNGQKYIRNRGTVKVYIEPSDYEGLMEQAYSEWEDNIDSIQFTFVSNPSLATDIVKFATKMSGSEAGLCQYKFDNNNLVGNTITIGTINKDGNPYPESMLYHTMLHEIGHSLGILGHSPYPGDIMHQGSRNVLSHLSDRDKATIDLLYQSYGEEPTEEEIRAAKMSELQDIQKRLPNDPNTMIQIGDELFNSNNYADALQMYKKAEMIKPSYLTYERTARVYEQLGDYGNLLNVYKIILSSYKKSDKELLKKALIICQTNRNLAEGQLLLKKFIEQNPHMENDSDIDEFKKVFSNRNVANPHFIKKKYIKKLRGED